MSSLPTEIVLEIIGYIHDEYSSLSLVSRRFRELTLPYQFKSLHFKAKAAHGRHTYHNHWTNYEPPSMRLLRAITFRNPRAVALAAYVQQCTLENWKPENYWDHEGDWVESSAVMHCAEGCVKMFSVLPNLVKLVFRHTYLTRALLEHVVRLSQLQSLQFTSCIVPSSLSKQQHNPFSDLKVIAFECDRFLDHRGWTTPTVPKDNLKILKSDHWGVTTQVLTARPHVQLTELWITSRILDSTLLWDYLAQATSLTHLSLFNPDSRLVLPPPLLPFFLPRLKYLKASVPNAVLFSRQPMWELHLMAVVEGGKDSVAWVTDTLQGIEFPHVGKLVFALPPPCLPMTDKLLEETFPNVKTSVEYVRIF